MSSGAASVDSHGTSDESCNSVLNFTDAAISISRERSRNGVSGDVSEPGGAPDIVLPHQNAHFVQHIAMDIGGSLIKLVYFTSSDDEDDCASSEVRGFQEFDTNEAVSTQEGSGTFQESGISCNGARRKNMRGAEDLQSSTQDTETKHDCARAVEVVNSTHSLHSHPICADDSRSHELLPEAENLKSVAPCMPPSCSGSPEKVQEASVEACHRVESLRCSSERGRQGGRLHFVKFESARIHDAIDFIERKQLLCQRNSQADDDTPLLQVHATGGGAFKFADMFRERLGVVLKKQDEMASLVQGTNFLLRSISNEAFEFNTGEYDFKQSSELQPLYPYLLVNIGSGVSFVKVDGEGTFERVSGTNLGGGTFWGLCRLMTRVRSFDEMLELSIRGDSRKVDMLVGDIYGGKDYASIGLSAETIASSFGKVVSQDLELEDYNPAGVTF